MHTDNSIVIDLEKSQYEELLRMFERDGYHDLNDYILHLISIEMLYNKLGKNLEERLIKVLEKKGIDRRCVIAFVEQEEGKSASRIAEIMGVTEDEVKSMANVLAQKFH